MDKKYEITDETQVYCGRVLHRIRALRDFELEHAEILDCPCAVEAGELGGWVEHESNLSQRGNCWIGNNAKVYSSARVFGVGYIGGKATVFANATVRDGIVTEAASVCGNARIAGVDVHVLGDTVIGGSAVIRGRVIIEGDSFINDEADIDGEDIWINNCSIRDCVYLRGGIRIWNSWLGRNADIDGRMRNDIDVELSLSDVQIDGYAVVKTGQDFIKVDPLDLAIRVANNSDWRSIVRALEVGTARTIDGAKVDSNDTSGATTYNKGNGWELTSTSSVTFYKTSDPDVIGLSAHTGTGRSYEIDKNVIITDPVFLAAINLAAEKFGILQNQFQLKET
jgi:carbonic anhydrase/acetyltransferase-like protein (isoleucine patch superfamily)